jgi:hypothetical protein
MCGAVQQHPCCCFLNFMLDRLLTALLDCASSTMSPPAEAACCLTKVYLGAAHRSYSWACVGSHHFPALIQPRLPKVIGIEWVSNPAFAQPAVGG